MEYLKSAMSYYAKSAANASEKWTFRATNKMGFLFVTMATKIREQELSSQTDEEKFAERIGIVQQLPSYYEQAMPIFQKNIDLARDQGFYNADVVAAEEGYIEMYYQGCAVFIEVADAFAKSPLPDSTSIVKEYMQNDGMTKDDAAAAAGDDLQAYRDELANRSKAAKDAGIPRCATGIKASAHYGIDNQWTKKLYDALQSLDTANEALTVKIQKFDASKLFQDPSYFKTKARIDQISKSDVMTPQEQLSTYRDIIKEAQDENAKLKEELQLLQQRHDDGTVQILQTARHYLAGRSTVAVNEYCHRNFSILGRHLGVVLGTFGSYFGFGFYHQFSFFYKHIDQIDSFVKQSAPVAAEVDDYTFECRTFGFQCFKGAAHVGTRVLCELV